MRDVLLWGEQASSSARGLRFLCRAGTNWMKLCLTMPRELARVLEFEK